ncbi:hypothetical protein JCM17960_14750 [Magnetospira thiophila]
MRRIFTPSIRTALILPTLLVILLTGSLVGYFSFFNARTAVNTVSDKLRREMLDHVVSHLHHFLNLPHDVLQENARALKNGILDRQNPDQLERHFLHQNITYGSFNSIYFGNTDGGLTVGGMEGDPPSLYVIATDNFTAGPFKKYQANTEGQRGKLLLSLPDFDARTRPWYKAALKAKENAGAWGDIYILFTGQDMAISPSLAVRQSDGTLLGVVGGDIFLSGISRFLTSLHTDHPGYTFIMEKSGMLVATSTTESPIGVSTDGKHKTRLAAVQSTTPEIAAGAREIFAQLGDPGAISEPQSLDFEIQGQRHFIDILPFEDPNGLFWLVATIIPEQAFMKPVEEGNRQTLYLIAASIGIMALIAALLGQWITRPILALTRSADAVARGHLTQHWHLKRQDEIGELSRSFGEMTRQLAHSFNVVKTSEERFKRLFENSEISIWNEDLTEVLEALDRLRQEGIRDLRSHLLDDEKLVWHLVCLVRVSHVNEATLKLFGATSGALFITHIDQVFGENALAVFIDELCAIWEHQKSFRAEVQLRHLDGHPIEAIISFQIPETAEGFRSLPVSIIDISDRKNAERALQDSESLFRAMTDTSPLAIYMSVGIEQRAKYINDRFVELFGYTLEDVPSVAEWWPLAYPDEAYRNHLMTEWQRRAAHAIETQSAIEPIETRVTCKDGSLKTISWGFVSLGDQNWAFGLDLTERKRAEQILADKTTALELSNADLQQFAYVASHDLREPLRSVSSFLELLSLKYQDALDQTAQEYIGFAVAGAQRMDSLIQDLLQYSRLDSQGKVFARLDTTKAVREALDNLQVFLTETEARVSFGTLPEVVGDRQQIVQLMQNLIENAIKYRAPDRTPDIQIEATVAEGWATFSVRDNGIGIEPQYFTRIFIIFQRLHKREAYQGTGLGLAVCKRIIDRHEGRIWVDSEPGVGSTFFFTLPVAA